MKRQRAKEPKQTFKVVWKGKEILVVAKSYGEALLIVGKQDPFDPKRDM